MSDQFDRIRLGELERDTPLWRYYTFPKFVSLLATGALWFAKLEILADGLEGMVPGPTRRAMKDRDRETEAWFEQEHLKEQVRRFVEDNESSGRELIVASCWFAGEDEHDRMWREYVGSSEGVAIRTTAGALADSLAISHDQWWIGRVRYVDHQNHDKMPTYEAAQAHLRAYLKDRRFDWESEVRVATMNWIAPGCLNPDGSDRTPEQEQGLTYSNDRAGILVRCNLRMLVSGVYSAPGATEWHHNLLSLLVARSKIADLVERSGLTHM